MTAVDGRKPLPTMVTKSSILDVVAALDPDLRSINPFQPNVFRRYSITTLS